MTELQSEILKVYKAFKEICDAHSLRYYAFAGTKLGAVRHKGFIPWDDDMDLCMPSADILKLNDLLQHDENYCSYGIRSYFDNPLSGGNQWKFFSKDTTYVENHFLFSPKDFIGVFIDIFPLIGTSANEKERMEHLSEIESLNNELYNLLSYEKSKTSLDRLDELCALYDYDESDFIAVAPFFEKEKFYYVREKFEKTSTSKFEDTFIPVSDSYDEDLTRQFGDWRELPPVEQRRGHHSVGALVNFSKPYSEYRNAIEESTALDYFELLGTCFSQKLVGFRLQRKHILDLNNRVNAIEQSTSWRITKPLRDLKKMLGRH